MNNSIIFEGTVIKDHFHAMHSNLGKWSHRDYSKGACPMEDRSIAVWQINKSESCSYIPHKNITLKIWDLTFLSDNSNIALTFQPNKTFTECSFGQLRTSHQGIPFEILHIQNQNSAINNNRKGYNRRSKRDIQQLAEPINTLLICT